MRTDACAPSTGKEALDISLYKQNGLKSTSPFEKSHALRGEAASGGDEVSIL